MNDTLPPEVDALHDARAKDAAHSRRSVWIAAWSWSSSIAACTMAGSCCARRPLRRRAKRARRCQARPLPVAAATARKGNIDVYIDAPRNSDAAQHRGRAFAGRRPAHEREPSAKARRSRRATCSPSSTRGRSRCSLPRLRATMAHDQALLKNAQHRPRALSNAAQAGFDCQPAGRYAGSARAPIRGPGQIRSGRDRQRQAPAHLFAHHLADHRPRGLAPGRSGQHRARGG